MVPRSLERASLLGGALLLLILISLPAARAADNASGGMPLVVSALAKQAEALFRNSALKGDQTRTRFLIGLEREVEFQVLSLANPNRVVVELPKVALSLPENPGTEPIGLVKSFDGGQSGPDKTRVVIYVTKPVVVETAKIEKATSGTAQFLALEIVPVEEVVKTAKRPFKSKPYSLGAADVQPPLPQPAMRPEELEKSAYRPIIVIDPGHGGYDSGAVKDGTVEKEVVLAFARVLRSKIEKTGRYRVLMTRDSDEFVSLADRLAFAEKHKAALFIAVHADYATTGARGATIYSLRENVASSLKRSAKGEVSQNVLTSSEIDTVKQASSAVDLSTVRNILSEFAEREVETTQQRTNLFTRSVIEYMGETTSMRDDPDQQAAFRVLKTAQFPSVLIELAYVTNKEDAALLKSTAWREKVADSITTAVENYFSYQIARLPM